MLPDDIKDREKQKFVEDASGNVSVRTNLVTGDIEIGAVEIKNAITDDRAVVDSDGRLNIDLLDDSGNSVVDTVNISATDYGVVRIVHYSPVTIGGSLPAGTNNIGDVDVLTLPDVDVNDISKGSQTNDIKITLDTESVTLNSLPAGTNNIGDVDIASALPTGSNRIGDSTPTLGTGGAKDLSYKLTLTANTATKIPETANVPSYDYVLVIANRSDTVMVWGVDTGIISAGSVDKGVPLIAESGAVSIKLSASEYLYVACSGAKDVDYSILSVERS